jgi:hypothetical protein
MPPSLMMVSRYRPSPILVLQWESVIGAPQYRESVIGEGQYREGYRIIGGGQYWERHYRGRLKARGILNSV